MPRLVEPAYRCEPDFVETLGPEVADLCEMVGFGPDPEQRLGLDLIFALDGSGRSAATEFATVVSRQNLKTGLFKQAALGWMFVTRQRLVVWSAHEFSTTREALRDLDELIGGTSFLARHVKRVLYANGQESIELTDGRRIIFKARTKTGGRGLTGDKTVLDEAFALTDDHLGSLVSTMSARPDPQLLYGSSAGMSTSAVLRKVRDRGRAGTSPRLAYLEWCAEREACPDPVCRHEPGSDGCLLDREDLWKQANPLLGRTRDNGTGLTYEFIRSERQILSPDEFARERMGWWDDPAGADPVFGQGEWEKARTDRDPTTATAGIAVAVSYDLSRACFSGATVDQGVTHVRPLHHGPGTGWVADKAVELQEQTGLDVVIDGKGPGADLIGPLTDAGVRLKVLDTAEVLDACAGLWKRVQDRLVAHQGYPELDAAVSAAVKRQVGDRWAWGRKKSDGDISPLESVTFAAWAAQTPLKSAYEEHELELV